MQPKQPKINQRLILRSAIGLLALAGLIFAFRWYKERETDPGGGARLATAGWIAAIETSGDGRHAVAIKDDGTILRQPGLAPDIQDRDPAWRPDGNYLFFSSNREKGKYSMFRWFPDGSATAEMRSLGGLSQGAPVFRREDADRHADATGLITAGGRVMEYDPKKPALRQVLPPPDANQRGEGKEEGGASTSQFEGVYERFGTSFRKAMWTADRKAVYAVMRGELGETLIYQKLDFVDPQEGQPHALAAGDRVDFDVDQDKGIAYFTVEGFRWPETATIPPEYIKNGKVTTPFKHGIGIYDPAAKQPLQMILRNGDAQLHIGADTCFADLSVSPDGGALAVVAGKYAGNGNIEPAGLFVIDVARHSADFSTPLVPGEVFEPTWSPDSSKIAFARRESSSNRPIYTVEYPGGTLNRRTTQDGVFGFPVFSPQTAK